MVSALIKIQVTQKNLNILLNKLETLGYFKLK